MELKEIAGYLPYELKVYAESINKSFTIVSSQPRKVENERTVSEFLQYSKELKPFLRPLSQLEKEIVIKGYNDDIPFIPMNEIKYKFSYTEEDELEFDGEDFTFVFEGDISNDGGYEFERTRQVCSHKLSMFDYLYQWYFDIYGLIEKNEAIDMSCL